MADEILVGLRYVFHERLICQITYIPVLDQISFVLGSDNEHVRSLITHKSGLQGLNILRGRRRVAEINLDIRILFLELVNIRSHSLLIAP